MKSLLLRIPSFFGISIEVYLIAVVIAIPFFFFWRRLFRTNIKSELGVVIVSGITALITAPAVYAILVVLLFALSSYYPNNDFDRVKWLADKDKRYELSENIIQSKMLLGRTKAQVKQILGANEEKDDKSDDWHYYLGYKPGIMGIDPDTLDVQFNDGKVISVSQHET